jgi:hypothetical protein
MDMNARMTELSRVAKSDTPVVSVYLDTRWSDEKQRDRVRIFLKNEIAKAREVHGRRAAPAERGRIGRPADRTSDRPTASVRAHGASRRLRAR